LASYGRDTDDDEVQQPKELTVMGRKTRKLSAQRFTFVMATKRSLAKASIDPGCTPLLDYEDLKVISTDQEQIHDG
jgi:4'-phosphopantetheinyl transferase EntD